MTDFGESVCVLASVAPRLYHPVVCYDIGSSPNAVALGDLDSDSDLDVIVSLGTTDDIVVLQNDADGELTTFATYPVEPAPNGLALGDLDLDDDLDLIVTGGGRISVLLNDGSGNLASPVILNTNNDVAYPILADLNCDGVLDIASRWGSEAAQILVGDGTGSFAIHSYVDDVSTDRFVLTDFSRDGHLDFIGFTEGNSGEVRLTPGTGCGLFAKTQYYQIFDEIFALAIADLSGDGSPDIVGLCTGASIYDSSDYLIAVAPNDGFGGLLPVVPLPAVECPRVGAAADLDADGLQDLVICDGYSVGLTFYYSDGPNIVSHSRQYPATSNALAVAVGDLDEDGDSDVAMGSNQDGSIIPLLNDSHGTLVALAALNASDHLLSLAAGDVTGDRLCDLVSANGDDGTVSVFANLGNAVFAPGVAYPAGLPAAVIALADLDGNDLADAVVANEDTGTISVLLAAGNGSLLPPVPYLLPVGKRAFDVDVADLSGDGMPELISANFASGVSVFINDGIGGFSMRVDYGSPVFIYQVVSADMDADGDIDVVGISDWAFETALGVLLNDGAGTLTGPTISTGPSSGTPYASAAGDVSGDGRADVLVSSGYDLVSLFVAADAGVPEFHSDYAAQNGDIALGLLNSDAALDLITVWQGRLQVRLNTFDTLKPCLADCDGDGNIDIFDYLCFQGLVTTNDPAADCNADGAVNIFDFLCFQGLVTQGCG